MTEDSTDKLGDAMAAVSCAAAFAREICRASPDLTGGAAMLLAILAGGGGTMKASGALLGYSPAGTWAAINLLEAAGLVARSYGGKSRGRATGVSVTTAGMDLLRAAADA